MAQFTLDAIRAAADAKYGSTDIDLGDGRVCVLVNPLRLPKEKRDELTKLQDKLEAEDADQQALMCDAIRLAANGNPMADALLDLIGNDLAVLAQVFEMYGETTQVGEASASAA